MNENLIQAKIAEMRIKINKQEEELLDMRRKLEELLRELSHTKSQKQQNARGL
ncbi:MAG: hypothetical protein K2P17_01465 [Helicobacteraceae bacterium]|nr:hypothetical protein [Helicobacteraceae bacterium]